MRLMFWRKQPKIEEPCWHMRGLLNDVASHKSRRFAKLYVMAHTARCGPCRRFLEQLEAMLDAMKSVPDVEPSPESIQRMMKNLD